MEHEKLTIEDVVVKLIGPINPVGDSSVDQKRLENLKALCKLTDKLLYRIDRVACENKDRQEWSMKEAGKFASDFFDKINIKE